MKPYLKTIKDFPYNGQTVNWSLDQNNVSHIRAQGHKAMAYALGKVHAKERGFQVSIFQTLIRGKLTEWLGKSEEALETDTYIIKLGFYYEARKEASQLSQEEKSFLQAYIDGLNEGRRAYRPFEAKLLQIPYHPWTIADSLALIKIMTYFGLAQTQQDFEKFICLCLADSLSPQYLKSLFPKYEQGEIDEIIPLLKETNFDLIPIPKNKYTGQIPSLKASNNWVLSPKKSEGGSCLFACDPHLEVNRLPAIWFEACWSQNNNYVTGITLPGLPGFIMGRNKDVAFSFTYGYMDCIDYFLEEIKDTQAKSEQAWCGLNYRNESIIFKNKKEKEIRIYETERGILEVPESSYLPNGKIKDGFYLARAWTGHNRGSSEAISCFINLLKSTNVDEASDAVKNVFFSANWVFGDKNGNISYQQTGRAPIRKGCGLYPVLASKKSNQWQSFSDKDYPNILQKEKNPDRGFITTANHDVQKDNEKLKVNLPIANYRFDLITRELSKKEKLSIIECKTLQSSLYSLQAELYMEVIQNFIPETPTGRILKEWNKCYDVESKGAYIFEKFLSTSYQNLFGDIFGKEKWVTFSEETTLLADYYGLFDRILLNPSEEDSCWFKNHTKNKNQLTIVEKRNQLLRDSLNEVLKKYPIAKLKKWGEKNSFFLGHFLFGTNLPKWLPWNKGDYPLPGSRATICQGNLFKDRGRNSSFAPSFRMVTDMAHDGIYSLLPGGPSDRFYKKSYFNDFHNWINFNYKTVVPEGNKKLI